ncbi:MAG: aromatic hydrocarbon degradation protein [Nitrosospira sp. 56-18]|nr:outer membrane protein transport protein [Nitrosospira sp.]OJY13332.1 MAG: aromatic hydrocarbon degradation protein [Nitrosospira sp. 56-18]
MQPSRLLMALSLAGSMSVGGSAAASGFALQNQNGAGNGYAYAGAAAVAQDASTIYFNPAGMTYLAPGHHISGAGNLLIRSLKFNDAGSGAFLSYPLGDNGGQAGGLSVIPAVYWSMSLGSAFRVGLGVSPTFGNATDWSKTFIGRYQGVKSGITTVNFNPSIAWKLHEDVSVGIGFNVVMFDADLRSMAPVTSLLPVPVDIQTRLKGDDVGFGYNLGVMFRLSESTRMGLTYRSAVDLKVDGHLSAPGVAIPASVPVKLPGSASLAISHMMNERLRLLADLTWTGWSSLPAIVAKNQTSGAILANERLGFEDSFRVGLGAQYQYTQRLRFHTGFAYDRSPVRNSLDRTVRLPDSDRFWLAVGLNQKLGERTSIDVGYSHVFFEGAEINRPSFPNPSLQVVRGSFDTGVHIISLQLNHHF